MSEESKLVDPKSGKAPVAGGPVLDPATAKVEDKEEESSGEEEEEDANNGASASAGAQKKKKKKSKKKKLKEAILGGGDKPTQQGQPQLTAEQLKQVLDANPALKRELEAQSQGPDKANLEEMLKKLNLSDLLTGLAPGGKNLKDMASYKFWGTQPVTRFDEKVPSEQGPIKIIDPAAVDKEPPPMYPGFEWVTMDLLDEAQLQEVYELLLGHYVEDDDAMFRFNYSISFLKWALLAPGWRKEWHVGVRATQSGKLVAFISAIPMTIRVRSKTINASEVNFLCVHKKLRAKRLAPVLIKEITRRCYLVSVFQAIYTGGSLLPTPISTCRYFHRSLNWSKLYEVGFSPMPPGSTVARQVAKYKLPAEPSTAGLRRMEQKDVSAVTALLKTYLDRTELAQEFTEEEVAHWFLQTSKDEKHNEDIIWTYVVENGDGKVTDFFSYYLLESTVIGNTKHKTIRAAYLFYYASDAAFDNKDKDNAALKARLNELVHDALILAKNDNFDVFNALTLLDNPLFLIDQKFGPGDGQLHFYLFNYKCAPIVGGVNEKNEASDKHMTGVGIVML